MTEQQNTSLTWAEYVKECGENLRTARMSRGMSQENVAKLAGITKATYGRLERGEGRDGAPADPQLKTLLDVLAVLGINLTDALPARMPDMLPD